MLARNQLVLDFGRPDVRDHLFDAIDALLVEYDISSLKWDMNRAVLHGARDGRAGTHDHVRGVYELIDRLRVKHPQLRSRVARRAVAAPTSACFAEPIESGRPTATTRSSANSSSAVVRCCFLPR